MMVPAWTEGEMNDTDARLWHPWLRVNRVLRVMLHERGRGTRGRCGELDGGVEDTAALGHDFLARSRHRGSQRYGASCGHLPSASS